MKKLIPIVVAGTALSGCIDNDLFGAGDPDRFDIASYEAHKSSDLTDLQGQWVMVVNDMSHSSKIESPFEEGHSLETVMSGDTLSIFTIADPENDGDSSISILPLSSSESGPLQQLTLTEGVYSSEDGVVNLTLTDNGRLTGTIEHSQSDDFVIRTQAGSVEMIKVGEGVQLEGLLTVTTSDGEDFDVSVDAITDGEVNIEIIETLEGVESVLFSDAGRAITATDASQSYHASLISFRFEDISAHSESGDSWIGSSVSIPRGLIFSNDRLYLQDLSETAQVSSQSYSFNSASITFSGTHVSEEEPPVDFTLMLNADW